MEYYSDPQAHSGQACSYMIGSFDPSSSKLTVAAAPLHIMSTRVKALKNLAPIVSSTAAANAAARATLGTAFGTKKAQRAIKTAERNQIDPESMKHVQDHLFASIATNTAALPTKEEVQASADALRPIPPFKLDAKAPKDVYELSGIVSSAELKAVPIDRLMKASQPDDAIALLPFRCEWIRVRIEKTWRAHPNGKLDKKELKKLKMLVYLSYLMAARAHGTTWFFGGLKGALTVGDRGRKKKKVKKEEDAAEEPATQDEPEEGAKRPVVVHCPDNVVEGLLSRFTETPQGSTKALVTSFYSMKLLSYIAALCLLYDDCACALGSLASDLQMDRKKSALFPLFSHLSSGFFPVSDRSPTGSKRSSSRSAARSRNRRRPTWPPKSSSPKLRAGAGWKRCRTGRRG